MSQAMTMYYCLKSLDTPDAHMCHNSMPLAMQTLYHAVLAERCKIKSCKKKWFYDHYTITVEDRHDCGYKFYITPDKMWWECFY